MTERTLDPNGTPVVTTYTFSEFDDLLEIDGPLGTVSNSYDANGARKQRIGDDGTILRSVYHDILTVNEVIEPSVGDPVPLNYVLSLDQTLGFERDGDFFYFLFDGLSSTRVVVDETGAEAAHYIYAEFGQRAAASEMGVSSHKTFVGGLSVHDEGPEAGLYYMRHRWQDPSLGRFLSLDPVKELNRYIYTSNNPVNFVDPIGLLEWGWPLSPPVGPPAAPPAAGATSTGAGISAGLPKVNPLTVLLFILTPTELGDGTCDGGEKDDDDDRCKQQWKLDIAFCGYCTGGRLQDTCELVPAVVESPVDDRGRRSFRDRLRISFAARRRRI